MAGSGAGQLPTSAKGLHQGRQGEVGWGWAVAQGRVAAEVFRGGNQCTMFKWGGLVWHRVTIVDQVAYHMSACRGAMGRWVAVESLVL
jgi:hypothetical protein